METYQVTNEWSGVGTVQSSKLNQSPPRAHTLEVQIWTQYRHKSSKINLTSKHAVPISLSQRESFVCGLYCSRCWFTVVHLRFISTRPPDLPPTPHPSVGCHQSHLHPANLLHGFGLHQIEGCTAQIQCIFEVTSISGPMG